MANTKCRKRTEGKSKKRKKKWNEFTSRNKLHCNIPSSVACIPNFKLVPDPIRHDDYYRFVLLLCFLFEWVFLSSSRLIFSFIWFFFPFSFLLFIVSPMFCTVMHTKYERIKPENMTAMRACHIYFMKWNRMRVFFFNLIGVSEYNFGLPNFELSILIKCRSLIIISDVRNADGFHCVASLQFNISTLVFRFCWFWHMVCHLPFISSHILFFSLFFITISVNRFGKWETNNKNNNNQRHNSNSKS